MRSFAFRKAASSLLLPLLLVVPATAQQPTSPSPAPSPGPTSPTSPGNTTGSRPNRPTNPFPEQRRPGLNDMEMNRPIMLSGRVMLNTGTPPPEPVLIERVCSGYAKPEGYTDSKGRFSFTLGQNAGIFNDASVGSDPNDFGGSINSRSGINGRGISERDLAGCEIRASLSGFRSTVVPLVGRRSLDNPDVGTLVLERLAKVDGFTFSATTGMAPKDAVKAFEKANNLIKKKKYDEASTHLEKAVELYPNYAVAWNELGALHMSQSRNEKAREAFAAAIKADSRFIKPYAALARIAASERNWADAAETSRTLIRLNPYVSGDVYFVSGIAHLNTNSLETAEDHTREAMKFAGRQPDPRLYHLLGTILAQKNDLTGAAENLRTYLKLAPSAPNATNVQKQLAELDGMLTARDGKTTAPAQ